MMKCSNSECGSVGSGKFCPECGSKMIEEQTTVQVVLCRVILEDGSVCGTELTQTKRFCSGCGQKIDPSLFNVGVCPCGSPLDPTATFCVACGTKRAAPSTVVEKAPGTKTPVNDETYSERAKCNVQQIGRNTTVSTENSASDSRISVDSDFPGDHDEKTKSEIGTNFTHHNTPKPKADSKGEGQPDECQIGKLQKGDDTPDKLANPTRTYDTSNRDTGVQNEKEEMKFKQETQDYDTHRSRYESEGNAVLLQDANHQRSQCEKSSPGIIIDDNKVNTGNNNTIRDEPMVEPKVNKLNSNPENASGDDKETGIVDNTKATFKMQSETGETLLDCNKSSTSWQKLDNPQLQIPTLNPKLETGATKTDLVLPSDVDDLNRTVKDINSTNKDRETDVVSGKTKRNTRSTTQGRDPKDITNEQNTKQPEINKKPTETRMKKPSEKCIAAEFHVLTSKEFKFDPSTHDCFIVFGNEDLGGWNKRRHALKAERQLDEHVYHLKYERYIPTRLVCKGQSTPYKYVIKKRGSDKETWEHYIRGSQSGKDANRELSVLKEFTQIDVWKQFDYMMERKPSGFMAKTLNMFTWTTDLRDHLEMALTYFCPDIPDSRKGSFSGEKFRYEFKMLITCAQKIYFTDANCWFGRFNDFKKWMSQCLLSAMAKNWKLKSTQAQKQHPIAALFCLYIMHCFKLEMPDKKTSVVLCENLTMAIGADKQECQDLIHADKYFSRSELLAVVLNFVKNILEIPTYKNPCWMNLLPWIHFLSGECMPFQLTSEDASHDKTDPTWWGISLIKQEVDKFNRNSRHWEIPVEEMLKRLSPFFKVDYLLPRSFITTVELTDLLRLVKSRELPIHVCLAHLTYRMKTVQHNSYYVHSLTESGQTVQNCVKEVLTQLQDTSFSDQCDITEWNLNYRIASDLLHESIKARTMHKTICSCVQVFVHCHAFYENLLQTRDNQKPGKDNKHNDIMMSCARDTVGWVGTYDRWDTDLKHILDVWNNCLAPIGLPSTNVKTEWNKILSEALLENLKQKVCKRSWLMEKFVHLYCGDIDEYNPCMQECMGRAAFFAIAQGYTVDYGDFTDNENKRFGSLFSAMFITAWKKNVKINTELEEASMLKHVLSWPSLSQYLNMYYKDKNKYKMLTEECLDGLVKAVSIIEGRLKALLTGAITIGDLQLISEKAEKFPQLAELIQEDVRAAYVQKTIVARQKELEAFQVQAKQMSVLAALCQHLEKVNTSNIDVTLTKQNNIDLHQLCEFCKPIDVNEVPDINDFVPSVCAFSAVSDDVLNIVPTLCACYGSATFFTLWSNQCRQLFNECPELVDVVKKIWIPVKDSYDRVTNTITTGEIKFIEFEKEVGHIYKENYDQMRGELAAMEVPHSTITLRVNQLQQYRQLKACVEGAKVIEAFKNEFKLTGDFDQIIQIASHGENVMKMRSFDDSLMQTCTFLHDLTDKRAKCLNTFVKCGKLITWLKESMKEGGLKELKVFVDLAFLSAGDEPINIARVECLHTAVTGYAPLIFELVPECGYKQLLEHCAVVWNELDANPNLPEMLSDTSNQLEWMKQIKNAHGSVEVTSLMQAEAINANGIYTIGKQVWKRDNQTQQDDNSLLTFADILELSVKDQLDTKDTEEKPQRRSYTFSQLQDLQSRLMLVAGKAEKGCDNVDKFTMIFDSLTRLSNVYLKLCSSGCVLFNDWTARFFCKSTRPVCVNLAFGRGIGVPHMSGRRSSTEDVTHMVPEIASFLENCLKEWIKSITEKRKSFLHLNYFTVDQLVILQRELVKVGTDNDPCHLIYPLLSAVKLDCSPDDLLEAMKAAKTDIEMLTKKAEETDEKTKKTDVIQRETVEDQEAAAKEEKRQTFIQELIDAGYDERLAVEASAHVEHDDISQGIVWCVENDTLSDDNEDLAENEPAQTLDFQGWSQSSSTNLQSLITQNIHVMQKHSDIGVKPLIDDLTMLWKEFLKSISSNMRDYMSLDHLGLILENLSTKDPRKLNRTLFRGFKEGEPNLVICPSADVLVTTLSIYGNDRDQPLPQSDEVLMCTRNTTADEVDIFWRRAILDKSLKIHCLVNADMLDYDVSESAERCLREYLLDSYHTELNYRLLVICSSDNEYSSTIISTLDKYKRHYIPFNINVIREYIIDKLKVQHDQLDPVKPAAFVDYERSTVRVIKSWRAGVGKSLFKTRRVDDLSGLNQSVRSEAVSIPLQEKNLDIHYVIKRLLEHSTQPGEIATKLFHIDVSHEVQNGLDYLLFNLLILGCLVDKTGWVWRKSPMDMYLIETMPIILRTDNRQAEDLLYFHQMLNVLPDLTCRSPVESLNIYMGKEKPAGYNTSDQLFDDKMFRSPEFQRPFQYLTRLDKRKPLADVKPKAPEGDPKDCLKNLLSHCGLRDPSWSELHHFVWFLNTQLIDFEQNVFVSAVAAGDLPGFSKFVLKFLIQMSGDFSTRSLDMSEESTEVRPDTDAERDNDNDLQAYKMRRTWESSPHPYLFFNSDKFTFTFLGFNIEKSSGNLIDQKTGNVLEKGIMDKNLYEALVRNQAPLQENFDALPRDQKILKLCNVMGLENIKHDPDDSYELTTDNVKKILAIYMRFRCDIPVIIMGETGCGKTRLIKFMCALQVPPGKEVNPMILMKVHGGTTHADIIRKVREAEEEATRNREVLGEHIYTVLFFDEANTTEAIGLIKEIMCDQSMGGEKLKLCENLKIVAACNPYRKHSDELIESLEKAGLGYHVDVKDTADRLGRVPMRRLVYRVQPLPHSMLPLVWDFGQLNTEVEDLYIRQMVRRYIRDKMLPDIKDLVEVVSAILTASQGYMREQKNECSFVSLRDVDRVLAVMSWFYKQSMKTENNGTLFALMDEKLYQKNKKDANKDEKDEKKPQDTIHRVDNVTRSLILALGVCYHACLKTRTEYRVHIAKYFRAPCLLPGGAEQMKDEIESCQEVYLDHVNLEKNIARNMALKENVFMMVVCIELRIPIFLVGKPGSSKSLAKTIVSDAMQGNAARKDLFRELKQAQMVSFQCSPLSTPDGIVGTFRQCARFQKDKDLDTFVSIAVLDEVGLAEDSPKMPLKTLHPLLEDGCQGDEKPEKHKKVAFIGISNWALDPAKMNRGILVQREVPDLQELKNSATGICQTEDDISNRMSPLIEPMAVSYREIFEQASNEMREFYGLRDFYSLVKMVYSFVEKSKNNPTWYEMLHSIKRNFGGLDQVDPVESFKKHLATKIDIASKPRESDPDCSPSGLIQACLFDTNEMRSESRYLLLLTKNYGALRILQQQILSRSSDIRPVTIFGSSFRSDQEYTKVCRNINKIKVCMETGKTVVLLNLENLYESLYDALNQYYVYFGGERYVDLGLGTHRVKCPVHKKFRLIVVAEKQTVYDKFPIPLINRLEKHFLTINTMLSDEQQTVVEKIEAWTKHFVKPKSPMISKEKPLKTGEVFIGYHDDTCSAIVLDVWEKYKDITDTAKKQGLILQEAKSVLLWCATPESIIRLAHGILASDEKEFVNNIYHNHQAHDCLVQYLNKTIVIDKPQRPVLAQVTTHSKLISAVYKEDISTATNIDTEKIMLLATLTSFDTEQQFTNSILHHIKCGYKEPSLMIIQCDSGDMNANLVACARNCIINEFEKLRDEIKAPIHVVFIVQLPRGSTFAGFQCGVWHSAHIDDLYADDINMPTLKDMQGKSVAGLFRSAVKSPEQMDVEEEHITSANLITAVKAEDDQLQLNSNADDERHRQGLECDNKRLNVKGVILNCVQASLCMVKDTIENRTKDTDRIEMVLTLLDPEKSGDTLLYGICSMIAKLLEEKEFRLFNPKDWLIKEAASNDNISKAGTFRQSCIQTLENKIVLILAGIIACLDTNGNLKILLDEQCSWKQRLWLGFLNTPNAINLQYEDLLSPSGKVELSEVVVKTTGCECHLFDARFPFSWYCIQEIDEILKVSRVTNQSNDHDDDDEQVETKVENAVRILGSHPVGDLINRFTNQSILEEAVEEYVQDFVHTMYNASTIHEQQFVCQLILNKARQMMHASTDTPTVLHHLVYMHLAYESLAPRLTYFRAMNSIWPECSKYIINLNQKNPDQFTFKEHEFTFSTVCLLIENLTPKRDDLNEQSGRSKWLNKVHRYRPVIEKVISLHSEHPELYGDSSSKYVYRAKALWSCVLVMKLFLEHVCASEKEEKIGIKHCMPLWILLRDATNFKEMKSLTYLERFLKSCNKQAMKQYFGGEVKCCSCERVLEGPPIILPCNDSLCDQCYEEMEELKDLECTKCHQIVPEHWTPVKDIKEYLKKFKNYQKRCNTFFMDVVSQLCFADNVAPSHEVVEKLLGFIFLISQKKQQRTRDMTVFDTGLDPNPVFRSFLLQLLMKTSEEHVKEHLSNFLQHVYRFIDEKDMSDQAGHLIELSLLVIQCIEDKLVQESNRVDEERNQKARCALDALQRAKQGINMDELTVEKLYALARARMGLAVAMHYVAKVIQDDVLHVEDTMKKVMEAAQMLSDETNTSWIRAFAVKYLCRCYGIDVYQMACKHPADCIHWLADEQTIDRDQVMEMSDRYIVSGDCYIRIRESVSKVLLEEKTEHLQNTIQGLRVEEIETMLQLAIHREITCLNVNQQHQSRLSPQDLMQDLVRNTLQPEHLISAPGQDMRIQGVQCIIIHFLSVMSHLKGETSLLKHLLNIICKPQDCTENYLPTMPQDVLDDFRDAFLGAQGGKRDESIPIFYLCPNGHPYLIGDCGRPYFKGKCRDCGAQIGGSGHTLLATNKGDMGEGPKMTGHILDSVDKRGGGPKPEREMRPAYCAIIRMIVHLSMYLGCRTNTYGIQSMIRPEIALDQVTGFIWNHILQDIEDIHVALSRSVDDVLLTMHVIIDHVMKTHTEGETVADDVYFSSRPARREWERLFSAKYVQPVLQDLDNLLKNNNQLLAKDTRLGANPLLSLMYETTPQSEAEDPSMLQQIPRVWRYRTPITLLHLQQEVDAIIGGAQGNKTPYKVLQLFLKEYHHLRALKFIPSIFRLHRALFHKYQRKLDKAEASQITVSRLKQDAIAGEDTVQLIQDCSEAWELVRNRLSKYLCPTALGGMTVPKEYCIKSIHDTTPITMLLPTIKEAGLCTYALLDCLMRTQNDFLDRYLKEAQRDSSSIMVVSPRDVTSANLISYDTERDILPLVLANCQYSFEMGKGTKIEYDFAGLERQLMDRFLFSKSRIDIGSVLQIDEMIYRTEFTNTLVFQKLGEKIPQNSLSAAVKTQITDELKSLPDICRSLDNLDITISFLKSTGGSEEKNLHTYMVQVLRMSATCIGSQRARQMCELQHCKSLWLLLTMLKAKIMVDRHQPTETTFESVSKDFHEEIPPDVTGQFEEYMKNLSVEKLSQLVEVLHEFILLKVAVREHPDSEDYMETTNNQLGQYLDVYIEDTENDAIDINILAEFPADILYRHSVHTWICAYNTLHMKQTGNRRQ